MGAQAQAAFPRSPEIKRLIKAATDAYKAAGLQVGSIDVRPDGITIYPAEKAQGQSAYDIWKAQN